MTAFATILAAVLPAFSPCAVRCGVGPWPRQQLAVRSTPVQRVSSSVLPAAASSRHGATTRNAAAYLPLPVFLSADALGALFGVGTSPDVASAPDLAHSAACGCSLAIAMISEASEATASASAAALEAAVTSGMDAAVAAFHTIAAAATAGLLGP